MPVGQLQDRYWFLKNLRRHRERVKDMKAETDSSAPKLPVDPRNDKRKVGVALQRVQKINNDNARLLVRLSKVFANGGNLTPADLGKDPKLEHQRKALRNNASKMIKKRAELNRITFDNKFLLNRILDVPSVINYKDEHYLHTNKRHKQLREETTYYRQKHSPFPVGAVRQQPKSRASSACSGRSTFRERLDQDVTRSRSSFSRHGSVSPTREPAGSDAGQEVEDGLLQSHGIEPAIDYLAGVQEDHLAMLLAMRRPPELVKRVFSALMIMVSPFEPTHVDISWIAVQEWVKEVGTVGNFMANLTAFDVSMVPAANPERTAAFMRQSGLSRERLLPLSDSLANLADWLMVLCIEAGATGFLGGEDDVEEEGEYDMEPAHVEDDAQVHDLEEGHAEAEMDPTQQDGEDKEVSLNESQAQDAENVPAAEQ